MVATEENVTHPKKTLPSFAKHAKKKKTLSLNLPKKKKQSDVQSVPMAAVKTKSAAPKSAAESETYNISLRVPLSMKPALTRYKEERRLNSFIVDVLAANLS